MTCTHGNPEPCPWCTVGRVKLHEPEVEKRRCDACDRVRQCVHVEPFGWLCRRECYQFAQWVQGLHYASFLVDVFSHPEAVQAAGEVIRGSLLAATGDDEHPTPTGRPNGAGDSAEKRP